ncbi:hypothetical protein [Methylobacterium nodulans]|uniref:Uncharacterized protein n=1 Tax=Methylobacterium nodulans (strain LMG 21967 / CNCM I-2342 / ORS 2060) TaxID=460265 RepID=B8IKY3_METNO|nr:hypothetical protein [Methylobacterium nodulans]ACL58171.1 hypothetical protein Mnod_3247 [Methylobacterium nodulans ORS 2060]
MGTDSGSARYSVSAGTHYELQAYYAALKCAGLVIVNWFNSAGSAISTAYGTLVDGRGGSYAYSRSMLLVTAPAGAAYAEVICAATTAAGAAGACFYLSRVMFAVAVAGQTEVSPYVDPGITAISGGGIITRSIGADRLVARSITAGEIAAGTITATEIAGGTITGDKIAGNTITGGNIKAGTLTARELAACSITTPKLAVSSYNFAYNTELVQSTRGWNISGTSWGANMPAIWQETLWVPAGATGIRLTCDVAAAAVPAGGYFELFHGRANANGVWAFYPPRGRVLL